MYYSIVRNCVLLIGGILQFNIAIAQQDDKVNGNFEGVSFKEFVRVLQASTDYRFYYDAAHLENQQVNMKIDSMLVWDVLYLLFKDSDFYFAIDAHKNVFIVKDIYIQSKLPNDYFDGTTSKNTIPDLGRPTNISGEIQAAIQNKINIVGRVTDDSKPGQASVSGVVMEAATGNPIVGVAVFCEDVNKGTTTNQFGEYSIDLPKGVRELIISAVGYESAKYKIALYGDGKFSLTMEKETKLLNEVVIESEREINVNGLQMGFERLDIKTMKNFSSVMGEVDVLRVILALPGVQSVGEASTGLNVRGGSADQNLILYNDAVVYNPTHLFGFFTAFNPDEIKSMELLKTGIPVERGGRLSSVININSRSGNFEKFIGTGGIGLLTGKLTLEGPLIKDRTSLLMGVRSSYSNWLLRRVPDQSISNSLTSFYDINMNVSHRQDKNNNFYLSGYWSSDEFKFNEDSLYQYSNRVASLKWEHTFSDKLQGVFVLSNSGYNYSVDSGEDPVNAFRLSYNINQTDIKADFTYPLLDRHLLTFGFNSTMYHIMPGKMQPRGGSSLIGYNKLQNERAVESALFVGDNFEINPRISVYAGLRYSFFNALGPRDVYRYIEGLPKNEDTIIDTLSVKSGSIASYSGPEYRVSMKYLVAQDFSLKVSYNVMRQYLHMLSNTTSISPTDIWKLSDPHIKPQIGNQISIGIYKNLKSGMFETSLEGYYKKMKNMLDYRDGANLVLNHVIESDVLSTGGTAFGAELMIKKPAGKLNGWVSYTYSRSYLRTNSEFATETVNGGHYYPSNYDKPHAANLIGNYKFSHRFSLSLNTTYSTGRPITLPLAKYELENAIRLFYSERNQYRVPDYFRIDFSINLEGNHKVKKLAHSSWTFGVYNVTGRKNIYSVFFRSDGTNVRGYKMSIFGTPIPSVTYNFRF